MSTNFPDTLPAWLTDTPPVPDCPPWCTKPAGHDWNPADPVGLGRHHTANVGMVQTDYKARPMAVSIQQYETLDAEREQAIVYVEGDQEFTVAQARELANVLTKAIAALAEIDGGRA